MMLVSLLAVGMLVSCQTETGTENTAEGDAAVETMERKVIPPAETTSLGEAYTLVDNLTYTSHKEGIASGWQLDNRGGIPRTQLDGGYGTLNDISTAEGTAMIREFNKITEGTLMLETSVQLSGSFNGFSMEFRNEKGEAVCKAVTKDGKWVYAGQTEQVLLDNASGVKGFEFRVILSLDTGKVTFLINEKDCGTYDLAKTGADAHLTEFRYATGAGSTVNASLGPIRITANYSLNTDFSRYADNAMPFDWTGSGAVVTGGELKVQSADAAYTFAPVSGTVIGETEFFVPTAGAEASFALCCGEDAVVDFTVDDKTFYANGKPVYEDIVKNMWYRLRLEARTGEDLAVIWLNGRKIGEVQLAVETNYIDTVRVSNTKKSSFTLDEVRVFEKIYHDDYVPAPVRPAGTEDYIVGMNICSLWREGTHYGWGCISAYDDPKPVLGYYDEGVPETADWEIKYMVEHGIDFQAFCWYASSSNQPLHNLHLENQLHDGYMYAEYSDAMKYCLIWEASNASRPDSMASWKNYYVPYLIENYFKDGRYMTIDNQLVLCVFGSNKILETMGSEASVKAMFDYLEEEVRKLGFDGMIYLACGSSTDSLAAMGFDGSYCYNWGTGGYDVEVNKRSILNSASVTSMYTVPTVSVGFNSIPWHGIRYPMMTVEDYEAAHLWVRDEYLPQYAKKDTWQENFVMLSTWNEYGEGTYIMPSEGNGGFGYIDALRKVYTSEAVDESLNLVPTAEQLERITHLYPQHHRILRKAGYYDVTAHSVLTQSFKVDYADKTNLAASSIGNMEYTADGISGYVNGDALIVKTGINVPAKENPYLRVTISVPKGTGCEVFFITDTEDQWTQNKSFQFVASVDGKNEYILDMSTKGEWKDNIIGIRVDPGQVSADAGDPEKNWFTLTSLEFMSDPSRTIWINDQDVELQLYMETSEDGQVLMAFDPKIALDYRLNAFHHWDYEKKELTLEVNGHTVVYTNGSDKYLLDGVEKALGYTMYLQDALPMIPIQKFCDDVGYTCTIQDEEVRIQTAQYGYFSGISDRIPGQWEFDTAGDAEGWFSNDFGMLVADGTLMLTQITDNGDPIMRLGEDANLNAADYGTLEVRCRYKYDSSYAQHISMYFTTDTQDSMSEALSARLIMPDTDSGDEWVVLTADLTAIEGWKGLIKQLRFDPFNAIGDMEIDYIRFLPKE